MVGAHVRLLTYVFLCLAIALANAVIAVTRSGNLLKRSLDRQEMNILDQPPQVEPSASSNDLYIERYGESDWEESNAEPYGQMVSADEFQDLMKKAVVSADKDKKYPLYDSDIIGPSASKWLTRSEAAIRKDREMIEALQNYYIAKVYRVGTDAARARATAKGDMWINSLEQGARMTSMEDEIELTGERYGELAEHLWEEFMKKRQDGEKEEVLEAIDAKYQQALAMKKFWEDGTDSYTARVYAQMELRNFNEAWIKHEADPNNWLHSMDMQKHMARAIAWNARARQMLLEKQGRKLANKLQRKVSRRRREEAL